MPARRDSAGGRVRTRYQAARRVLAGPRQSAKAPAPCRACANATTARNVGYSQVPLGAVNSQPLPACTQAAPIGAGPPCPRQPREAAEPLGRADIAAPSRRLCRAPDSHNRNHFSASGQNTRVLSGATPIGSNANFISTRLFALAAASALAQPAGKLEELLNLKVTSATRTAQLISEAPAAVSVVTALAQELPQSLAALDAHFGGAQGETSQFDDVRVAAPATGSSPPPSRRTHGPPAPSVRFHAG